MADNNVFSVRLEEQDKEKLLTMIQESGRSNKEFMSVLLNAYELNKAKIEIPDLAKDIEGLQALTQRINEYYVNIGKRIEDTQKAKDIQYTKDVEVYKSRIESLKAENEKLSTDYEGLLQAYNNSCEDIEAYKKQLEQLQDVQESNKALIDEYKSKIDTLSGIIEEYKGYKTEIETVKALLSDANTKVLQHENTIRDKEFTINKINADLKIKDTEVENLKLNHTDELKQVNNRHDQELKQANNRHIQDLDTLKKENELNIKLAIAEVKEELNAKLQQEQQKHNADIQEYQAKYKALLEELEHMRATHTTKKTASEKDSTK